MQNQEIEILVHPDGQIEYTIKGIQGAACDDISKLLEHLGNVEHEERTGEYYEYDDEAQISIAGS